MATDPKQPLPGERHIDASELDFLIDLPEGGTLGLQRSQEGVDKVVQEIEANQPSLGALVISSAELQTLKDIEGKLKAIARFRPAAEKFLEMLAETQAHLEDQKEKIITATAQSVESKSKYPGGERLLAKYQKTREYRSARGKKAAATRRKNAAPKAV